MNATNATTTSSSASGDNADTDNATVTTPPPAVIVIATTSAPKKQSMNYRDTCTWYTGVRCSMPRDCYDCLNVAVKKDTCAVDPTGLCVSIDTYTYYAQQRNKRTDPTFLGYFPSANFTYCASADDACQSCKARWRESLADTGVMPPAGSMCRGTTGCVCVAACEMPDRTAAILSKLQCSTFGAIGGRSKVLTQLYLGVGIGSLVLLCIVISKAWFHNRVTEARTRARQAQRERMRNRPLRTGPALALTGWSELRDKLLESEREFLEGAATLSAPSGARVEGESVQVEEEGEGARGSNSDAERDALEAPRP